MRIGQNRFQGSSDIHAKDPIREQRLETALAHGLEESRRFVGAESAVFARGISTEDFIKKLDEAMAAIVNADKFDVAFQEKIRMDPLLASAFRSFIDLMMSGQVKASEPKKQDAQVVERQFQVLEFLELFKERLESLKELRQSTPVDLTQLGLEIIGRNSEIQAAQERPLAVGPTLQKMAGLSALDDEAKKVFLYRLARAAVQEVQLTANQTDEVRQNAHGTLLHALSELVRLGDTKGALMEYYQEATRLADKLDAGDGNQYRIATEAIFLRSTKDADKKAAEARLRGEMDKLKQASEARGENKHLTEPQRESFAALLEVSRHSRTLFAEMPDFIELVRKPAFDEQGAAFRADKAETQCFQAMVASYVSMIGQLFPSLDDAGDKKAHREACEVAQQLILELVGTAQDNNFVNLVRELTRDRDLAPLATEIPDKFITNAGAKLNAFRDAVIGFLDNGHIDLAYENFHKLDGDGDALNKARQSAIFAKATQTLVKSLASGQPLEAKQPAREWLETSYLRGIESSLALDQSNPREAASILKALTGGEVKLDAQQTEDLVGKVQQQVAAAAFPLTPFIPALVGLLGRHPDSIEAMNKVKQLVEVYLAERPTYPAAANGANVNWHGKPSNFPFDASRLGLDLLEAVSKLELASGNVRRVAESVLVHDASIKVAFAERLPLLGDFAIKEELAAMLQAEAQPLLIPQISLPLATVDSTLEVARDLIGRYAELHLGKEVKDLDDATRIGLVQIEAALRIAVPNLMTAKALVGLVKAVQQDKKAGSVLQLLRTNAPQELIKEVLKSVDDAAIRDFLEGKPRRERRNASALPSVGEGVPVSIVEAGAERPQG